MFLHRFILTLLLNAFFLGCLAQQSRVSHKDQRIYYEGRIGFKEEAAELYWSGSTIAINFDGTGIAAILKDSDTANYYDVIIDGDSIYKIHTTPQQQTYQLASGLPSGKHSLQLFKRTEWDKGTTSFYGFELEGRTKLIAPPPPKKRKIEFFGNSITCGYGNEDSSGNDSGNGYFENNYRSYAAITARHFDAQYHCTAKSGIGITLSWFPLIMSEMYDRLNPTDSTSKWNFLKYTPDIVVINLLQNDSWLTNMPEHAEFKNRFGSRKPAEEFIIEKYRSFVQSIRQKYPQANIICMLGNMDITRAGSPWPGYVEKAVAPLNDKKIHTLFAPYKNTPGHPRIAEQEALANNLIQFIEKHIEW
jgi:lysophospholipase L1-like esterase